MIEFEIDGKKVIAEDGVSIIEAADAAGAYIPRFCYHKKLSIAANCRMCLVEVEKSRKPLPACATPITQDMKVLTKSKLATDAQRDVMEFLLINHPLDCPICDQGGECELQDLSMGFGRSKSPYDQAKRAVCSKDIGPLIETEMTRCIQCTRCVRFGEEVAGLRELGVVNRGEKEEITTYVKHFLKSEVSGNIIDICPVGALTNKPARYEVRGWEIKESESIAPHDCVGTNVYLHTRDGNVFRSVPRENENINEVWMSDRDRFSVEGLYHKDRVKKPLMKKNDKWVEVEWKYALDAIAHLTSHIKENFSADKIAGIAGYNCTTEEYYLFQKLIRNLGSDNIDYRIRQCDFSDYFSPQLNIQIADIEKLDALLLVGSNIRYDQPMISTRIFKAYQEGLSVMAVNAVDYHFVYDLAEKIIDRDIVLKLSEIVKALGGLKEESIAVSKSAKKIAEKLLDSKNSAIFLGLFASRHPDAALIRNLCKQIEKLSGATLGILSEGANSLGATIANCIPKNNINNTKTLLTTNPAEAYFLLNCEPEVDSLYPAESLENLSKAKLVVCFNSFASEKMREYADFILPITPYSETAGTFVNVTGDWQSFEPAVVPFADSKPAWKVLRALAEFMKLPNFNFKLIDAVRDEIKNNTKKSENNNLAIKILKSEKTDILAVFNWHSYRDNNLVRRTTALQELVSEKSRCVTMNSNTANQLNIKENDVYLNFKVKIDARVSDGLVILPAGGDQLC